MSSIISISRPMMSNDGKTVTADITVEGTIREYVTAGSRHITYSTAVDQVPLAIQMIPFVATYITVAWVTDSVLQVECIDADFARCLEDVRNTLRQFYPTVQWGGSLGTSLVNTHSFGDRTVVLFSGGVDSTASLIRHLSEDPLRLMIIGADIRSANERHASLALERLQTVWGDISTCKSNLRESVAEKVLERKLGQGIRGDWWGAVQHGLSLTAMAAPFSHAVGAKRVIIASSRTKDFPQEWGSSPEIDNKIRWSSTSVMHDGFELSRQDKVEIIRDYVVLKPEKRVEIRVCHSVPDVFNCSRCEKCVRTISAFLVAGLDPNNLGFSCSPSSLESFRVRMMRRRIPLTETICMHWEQVKERIMIDTVCHEYRPFVSWLASFPMSPSKGYNAFEKLVLGTASSAYYALPNSLKEPLYRLWKKIRQRLH